MERSLYSSIRAKESILKPESSEFKSTMKKLQSFEMVEENERTVFPVRP